MPRKAIRLLPLALVLAAGATFAPAAWASHLQQSVIQDDVQLMNDPAGTLATFRSLGADVVRVNISWASIAPNSRSRRAPKGFNASNPGAYPARNWAIYDTIVRDAAADHLALLFTLTSPAPAWATGGGAPPGIASGVWWPSARAFGAFVHAIGTRYDGRYKPAGSSAALPRVSMWSIWNEPNYNVRLDPQTNGSGTVLYAASEYRGLLAGAWGGLIGSGHAPGRDTILIGETAPRGSNGVPGIYGGIKPLAFLRALYCVDSRYRELRGSAARAIGCPTTAAGSRHFRAQNAALFKASGFADHPYTLQGHPAPPNVATNYYGPGWSDPDYADLPELHRLGVTLNRLHAIYGSHKHFPIWNTEYGYRTRPPDHVGVSQATQAAWINWAEYLSYRQPGVASFNQYLLEDPPGPFDSGLESSNGRPKPSFAAFRMPLWLPRTSTSHGRTLEVWGDVRPAHTVTGPQSAQIQFQPRSGGAFRTVRTVVITNPQGYFDAHVAFPGSGMVRIAWTPPGGAPLYSRSQRITIH